MHIKDSVQKLQKGSLNPCASRGHGFPHSLLYFPYWWISGCSYISLIALLMFFVILAGFTVPTFMLLAKLSKAFRSCMAAEWLFL